MPDKPLHFYMANLWSEVEKIFIWKERNDIRAVMSAYTRALSITDRVKKAGNASATAEVSQIEQILTDLTEARGRFKVTRDEMSSYLRPFMTRLSASPVL